MAGENEKAAGSIDFYTFVLSLASSAFVHLGDAPNPETGTAGKPDLALAKETIDIIAMLEEKTKGNVTEMEAKLLSGVLYDLRVKYVDACKKS